MGDWPRRIGLRVRHARDHRQRGSARPQIQKLSAGYFHRALPEAVFAAPAYALHPPMRFAYSGLMFAARITLAHFSVSVDGWRQKYKTDMFTSSQNQVKGHALRH
jgi:hypothetical protein